MAAVRYCLSAIKLSALRNKLFSALIENSAQRQMQIKLYIPIDFIKLFVCFCFYAQCASPYIS